MDAICTGALSSDWRFAYADQDPRRPPRGEDAAGGKYICHLPIQIPANYYPGDDDRLPPACRWRSGANLLFSNWLNYFVYQSTPYSLSHTALDWNGI